jgi:hypothetical protein
MSYAFGLINHDNFQLTADSILTVDTCYLYFAYKIKLVNSDSLILKRIDLIHQPVIKREYKPLIFLKDSCTEENNPFNNLNYLSFRHKDYNIILDESLGVKTIILNQYYKKVTLTEKSQNDLDNFFLNNIHNDTHMELFVFETEDGKFGVISKSKEVEIPPYYKSIDINYNDIVTKHNRLYSISITCTQDTGVKNEHFYYY